MVGATKFVETETPFGKPVSETRLANGLVMWLRAGLSEPGSEPMEYEVVGMQAFAGMEILSRIESARDNTVVDIPELGERGEPTNRISRVSVYRGDDGGIAGLYLHQFPN